MRLPFPVTVIAALFVAAMIYLIVVALVPKRVATFALGDSVPITRPPPSGPDTVTIDARDPERWVYFAFARGVLVPPDTAGWDLRVQRFQVVASGTARPVTIEATAAADAGPSDSAHAGIGRWYRYSFFSHLLLPKPGAYEIRSPNGRLTRLEFLSYYCPGPEAGCLTFRYGSLP